MNLELLDPFGRQIPDRVDATIQLPELLHPDAARDPDDDEWKAAYHIAYNRRGTYIAVGYGSGVTAVYSTLNRTLVALYSNHSPNGCSALSWSRRSRSLLAGAAGDFTIRFYDTTHPFGPEEASSGLLSTVSSNKLPTGSGGRGGNHNANNDDDDGDTPTTVAAAPRSGSKSKSTSKSKSDIAKFQQKYAPNEIPPDHELFLTQNLPFKDVDRRYKNVKDVRHLPVHVVQPGDVVPPNLRMQPQPSQRERYPCVEVTLPSQTVGSVQINPRRPNCALAVLSNGALVLVWIPADCMLSNDDKEGEPTGIVYTLFHDTKVAAVTCAAFDPHGDRVYAALDNGQCLGWVVRSIWEMLASFDGGTDALGIPNPPAPSFQVTSAAGVTVWHLLVSRSGRLLILNSADGAIRVYDTTLLWNTNNASNSGSKGKTSNKNKKKNDKKHKKADDEEDEDTCDEEERKNPVHVFQDVVTKIKFASTDISGDGEFVVGGANGADNKYELFIWNTGTGALLDKLTGQTTQLYAVAWHPTRSFLAVACADGLIDIWGPRINWTAFAPDFQALPMNVEYIEREDEFDVDENGQHLAAAADSHVDAQSESYEDKKIDVTTIEPVPVFASDSEDEQDVFFFETKLKNALSGFKSVAKKPKNTEDD